MRPVLQLVVVALLAGACARGPEPVDRTVTVGVGTTTEQRVLAALTLTALEQAAVPVDVRADLGGTRGLRAEALAGRVDLFWDYTGAAWALGMGLQAPTDDPEESWARVFEADHANGLTWLEPTAANATLALFVRPEAVPPEEPRTLTWLASHLSRGGLRLCADADFIRRPGGWEDLAEAYSIDRDAVPLRQADERTAIETVADGGCFVGLATVTSGAAHAAGLVPLADDQRVFPAFVVAPVVRSEALEAHPQIRAALAPLQALDSARLALLNAEAQGASPERLEALAAAYFADLTG